MIKKIYKRGENVKSHNMYGIPWGMIIILGIFLLIMAMGLANMSLQDLGNPQPSTLITQLHHLEAERPEKNLYKDFGR